MRKFGKHAAEMMTPGNYLLLIFAFGLMVVLVFGVFGVTAKASAREMCVLASVPNSAKIISAKNFWPTYEINCQGLHTVLSEGVLSRKKVTSSMLKAGGFEGVDSGDSLSDSEKYTLLIKDEFAQQLANCWKAGGNRPLFDLKAMELVTLVGSFKDSNYGLNSELVSGTTEREQSKRQMLQNKLGRNMGEDLPAVACMICSQTELGSNLETIIRPQVQSQSEIPLTTYLKNKNYGSDTDVSIYTVLTGKKEPFPIQNIGTEPSQSVVYYQYFETPDQMQDMSRTGAVILNTIDVPNFCDVIANRG